MASGLSQLLNSDGYLPHGICLAWQPELLALHVSSDVLTGLSYYSIPLALVYFVAKRRDLAFSWVFGLFALFILACGTTHLFSVWTLWNADYGMEGLIKAATALVSLLTAIALWLLMPKALALPSPRQLAEANAALQSEIAIRRQAEERYSGFFNNLAEGLFVVTVRPDGLFAYDTINPAHARATGLRPEAICGRLITDVLPGDPGRRLVGRYAACVAGGQAIDYEETVDLPVGRRTWHTVLVPVRDARGTVVQLLGSARDITERKQLQEELVQASKLATLGTLAAGMAHEMSQPLNVIRIWAENALGRLREGALDPERLEKVLLLVSEQTERMGRIIDHMRTFSRRDDNGSEVFDPAACVGKAVDLVRHQYALENVAVELAVDADVAAVRGRPLQLEQVVVNLLSNARDAIVECRTRDGHGSPGRIDVAVRAAAEGVAISVTDDGGGIPEHVLPRIFDPFFTTKEVGKGTGLGLSIGYGIIDAMRGRIEASNVQHPDGGRGVRFTIALPATSTAPINQEAAHG